jgi:hypothetical protein
MAVAVKDAATSAKKFVTNAQNAGQTYTDGVANAGGKWQANTKAAANTWSQGVQQAAQQGRFASGVNQTSANKFQTRASSVGPGRYTTGVADAGDAWQTNTQPFLNVIAGLTLPARGVKGSPQNINRVSMIAAALRAKKLGTNAA